MPGYCSTLLKISSDPEANKNSQGITTIAAVQLGTLVEYNWKFNPENKEKLQAEGFEF